MIKQNDINQKFQNLSLSQNQDIMRVYLRGRRLYVETSSNYSKYCNFVSNKKCEQTQ